MTAKKKMKESKISSTQAVKIVINSPWLGTAWPTLCVSVSYRIVSYRVVSKGILFPDFVPVLRPCCRCYVQRQRREIRDHVWQIINVIITHRVAVESRRQVRAVEHDHVTEEYSPLGGRRPLSARGAVSLVWKVLVRRPSIAGIKTLQSDDAAIAVSCP